MPTARHQPEPLLPSEARIEPLLVKAHALSRLAASLGGVRVPLEVRSLLRSMNAYYTHHMDGLHTRPGEIEQALRQDFSPDATLAAKQRLAVAHIGAEEALARRYQGPEGARALYSIDAVQDIHRELFGRLPSADLLASGSEATRPGQLRLREVNAGQPGATAAASASRLLARWAGFYGQARRGEAALVAMAAAHQRIGCIYPLAGGNGRAMRLHTHTVLGALGYTGGLWSPLRGFAGSAGRHDALLADADSLRRSNPDGRGRAGEQALIDWIAYVLDTCLEQAAFMAGLLDFANLKERIAACLAFESTVVRLGVRQESLRGLHYLFLSGESMARGDFKSMLGMSDRSATDALGALIKRGLLKSASPQGKVRFGLPQHALRFVMPGLWPEAEADTAQALSWPLHEKPRRYLRTMKPLLLGKDAAS